MLEKLKVFNVMETIEINVFVFPPLDYRYNKTPQRLIKPCKNVHNHTRRKINNYFVELVHKPASQNSVLHKGKVEYKFYKNILSICNSCKNVI